MITAEVFMDIISLHRQGVSMRSIAKKLGIHRNTVKKHIDPSRHHFMQEGWLVPFLHEKIIAQNNKGEHVDDRGIPRYHKQLTYARTRHCLRE